MTNKIVSEREVVTIVVNTDETVVVVGDHQVVEVVHRLSVMIVENVVKIRGTGGKHILSEREKGFLVVEHS
jgi:hypothetical protein